MTGTAQRCIETPEPVLLDSIPIACALYEETSGRLQHANPAFVREFSPLGSIATRTAFAKQFQEFDVATATQESVEVFAPKSARWYVLHWTKLDSTAHRRDTLVCANDITKHMDAARSHRKQQEKLMFTSRMMSVGEMATTIAHELNQPLATITNCLNVGLRGLRADASTQRVRDALSLAHAQARHADDVIHHFREFVRSREPKRNMYDLASIISSVVRLLTLEAQEHRVVVETDIAADLPKVCVDRVMIEQVLLNLLKNAIEAMHNTEPDRRRVVIRACHGLDRDVEVRVEDRGCGLTEYTERKLFSPFFSSKPDGMGVGLAICRSIIEYHNGRLVFERNPGGGCIFGFSLPVIKPRIRRGAA